MFILMCAPATERRDGTSRKRAHLAADNLDRYVRGEALVGQITSRFI